MYKANKITPNTEPCGTTHNLDVYMVTSRKSPVRVVGEGLSYRNPPSTQVDRVVIMNLNVFKL